MRAVRHTWTILAALIAMPTHAEQGVGDYRGLPADLAAAATAYDIAQKTSDRAGLERFLADDYTLANSNGANLTKAGSLAESLTPGHKTTYVAISGQVNKVWADGAVLAGIVDANGVDRGKPFVMRARFVDVWARRHGTWQVVFTQIDSAAPVPGP